MKRTARIVAALGLAVGLGVAAGGCMVQGRGTYSGGAVVAYEEPTLRQTFGNDYDTYCGEVWRWWPRP